MIRYSLDRAPRIQKYFEEYFEIPFPLSKQDFMVIFTAIYFHKNSWFKVKKLASLLFYLYRQFRDLEVYLQFYQACFRCSIFKTIHYISH